MEIPFKTAYGPHERVYTHTPGGSHVMASAQDECDINRIMARYIKTGILDHEKEHQGKYGEFLSGRTYHDVMVQIAEADTAFQSLPAEVRRRFNNNAGEFLEFVQDPESEAEMIQMGLARERPKAPVADLVEDPPEDPDLITPTTPEGP